MHRFILALGLAPILASASLTGSVGPLTTIAQKKAIKTCNVLDYGAVADHSTDLGAPLVAAFTDCKSGGVVYIPKGEYALSTWALLDKGNAWALQLDGTIHRTGTAGGNMITIAHSGDFELFSSTGKGAIQGLGYEFHATGTATNTRLMRLQKVNDFSVHDIALVDAPSFHLSLDTVADGEVYNLAIRGGDSGGLDGLDVWGENIWVHDVEVTNKDECVTIKNPSHNILVENIYCNWSGGCAMGSLAGGTDISDITYRNVYTWASNQMFMIKSNGGDGIVQNVLLENFIGHGNAYSLDIDSYWSSIGTAAGDGIEYANITISNWKGTEANGAQRGPIKILCPDGNPCHDITITDFAMWTESGDSQWYRCQSAYGDGFCLESDNGGDLAAYAATDVTATVAPSGYSAPTMAADLASAFGLTASIPIPTIPTSFFPGVPAISPLGGTATEVSAVSASTSSSTTVESTSSAITVESTPVSVSTVRTSTSSSISVESTTNFAAPSISTPTSLQKVASSSVEATLPVVTGNTPPAIPEPTGTPVGSITPVSPSGLVGTGTPSSVSPEATATESGWPGRPHFGHHGGHGRPFSHGRFHGRPHGPWEY